jgi:ABC-type branched-subunit amino acid transport system ATPase component/branched-subunit amino acid ABC-type transport system permease component
MDILRFALLGLGIGALYAVTAQGLVLIYRASGVVNFAQGAFVMTGAYLYYEARNVYEAPIPVVLVVVVLAGVAIGLLMHLLLMRPLRDSSPLVRAVATLGVLALLQAVAVLRYTHGLLTADRFLPGDPVDLGGVVVTWDRMIIFAAGLVITAILWTVYRFTKFGKVTTAVAENELAAAAMGHSPDKVAAVNWAVGAGLATLTGALVAQITVLEPSQLSALILPALAAAMLGGFSSFPLALVAGLAMGAAQSVLTFEVATHGWWAGWPQAMPFLLVIAYLVIRGRGIPLRSHIFDRLPVVGTGRIRLVPTGIAVVAVAVAIAALSDSWVTAMSVTMAQAVVGLSVLAVVGYAGQLSLAQTVIGAMGAFIAAKLMEQTGTPFELAFLLGVVGAMVIGTLLGAPALRTRGVSLAVVTLGIAITLYALFLANTELTGSTDGIPVATPTLFGLDLDPSEHPRRYAFAALVLLLLTVLILANLRRGRAGRRLLAVRSNERAALALGVSVYTAKLYAFMLAAGIAAVGMSILAFHNERVVFERFDVFTSIGATMATVVGGLGVLLGPIVGATLLPDSITTKFINQWGPADVYLPLVGAILVLLVLVTGADGIVEQNRQLFTHLWSRRSGRKTSPVQAADGPVRETERRDVTPDPVPPRTLTVKNLTVRFGGVVAVDHMNLTVRPGSVHGLIGPNGAGKTTFVDAVTGFVSATGTVLLDGHDFSKSSPRRRARLGVARSFQSGELFNDLTVRENLAVGCDEGHNSRYLTDLVLPGPVRLSPVAVMAAQEFELDADFERKPPSLPFGRRRLVSIARAVAAAPSVLLLDEPAAGLSDEEAMELARLIRRLADAWGIGVLLIEHNLEMVLSVADEITVMAEGGELLAASPPSVVRTHPDVLRAYVGGGGADPESDPGISDGTGSDRRPAETMAPVGRKSPARPPGQLDPPRSDGSMLGRAPDRTDGS